MDLSYILNSPDVERVATALETIAAKNASVDFSDAAKNALLDLLAHVAYTDTNGAQYISTLRTLLFASPAPTPEPEEYTWKYDPKTDGLPVTNANYTIRNTAENYITAAVSVDHLNIQIAGGADPFYRMEPKKITSNNATFTAHVMFNKIPPATTGDGFRIQLSNGTSGVQLYSHNINSKLYFETVNGTNHTNILQIEYQRKYKVQIKIRNGNTGMIYIDDQLVETVSTLASEYCTFNLWFVKGSNNISSGTLATDVNIYDVMFLDED